MGQVFVSANGGGETLFAQGAAGSATAPWISAGAAYVFTLYAGTSHTTPLALVTVTKLPALTLTSGSGNQGSILTVSGSGFGGNETVTLTWNCSASRCASTTTLGSLTTDNNGTFTGVPVTLPVAAKGEYFIGGLGGISMAFARAPVTMISALAVTPGSGVEGSRATVSGTGYGANEAVTLKWKCPTSACALAALSTVPNPVTTDASGNFSGVIITIPSGPSGPTVIGGQGVPTAAFASTMFTKSATLIVSPRVGTPGSKVAVAGKGYRPFQPITLKWNCASSKCGGSTLTTVPATVRADANGSVTGVTITIPTTTYGVHFLAGFDGSTYGFARAPITVKPKLTLTPLRGARGSSVIVRGKGYRAAEKVVLKWNCRSPSCGSTTVLASGLTDASGSFAATVTVPVSAVVSTTPYPIGVKGQTSLAFAFADYTITR